MLADGLSLAVEDKPDAIVDIATLTGACIAALGQKMAGVFGNDQRARRPGQGRRRGHRRAGLAAAAGATATASCSTRNVADMKNVGGPYGGAIIAALFLDEFVGDVPWAHLDIAGTMNSDADDGWLSKGATASAPAC